MTKRTKKIICLYGGPGTGKSTACAEIFALLKRQGFNCEMIREYVKDWVWSQRPILNGDQTYFFAKQSRLERNYMKEELDYIVTDSPLLLAHFYGMKYDPIEQKYGTAKKMLEDHTNLCHDLNYEVVNIFLKRVKKYQPKGRYQTESEAKSFDLEIKNLLENFSSYQTVVADIDVAKNVVKLL